MPPYLETYPWKNNVPDYREHLCSSKLAAFSTSPKLTLSMKLQDSLHSSGTHNGIYQSYDAFLLYNKLKYVVIRFWSYSYFEFPHANSQWVCLSAAKTNLVPH
jgi:hypothetical protein